ncbi:MAG: sigma-54 dependent transcriptional regulator [Myxococcota bacterium]|nr:sigma-54 dependent transcriptional regulator [Myxococcota bacterium]
MHTRPDLSPTIFHGMVTVSAEMRALFALIRRAAQSDVTVLVRGESGTGKELVARAIHAESSRSAQPLQAVNCATFTPELLASELFGHVKGAFTGATRSRSGLLAHADGGSLFLDEVAEVPLSLQARLLRVLQFRSFAPLGTTTERSVNVRIISATNTGLRQLVQDGRFREDLMYRIRVVVLYLPRLMERSGDLEALTWHLIDQLNARGLRQVQGISPAAWAAMEGYPWPGNIRELQNNLEQAFVLGEGPVIQRAELARELQLPSPPPPSSPQRTLLDLQRDALILAWEETGGSRAEMCLRLGISRATLYRRLKHHGLLG